MRTIEDYELFLKKQRKKNGDKLLPSTIERYRDFINDYFDKLETIKEFDEFVAFMNEVIQKRPSGVLHSAFRSYLEFNGFPREHEIHSRIKAPPKMPNAQTSVRFLQSKVLTVHEIRRLINESEGILSVIIAFLFDTACRRSELLNVRWADINFIDDPKDNISAEVILLGKGGKTRQVYLTKSTSDLVFSLKDNQDPKEKIFVFYEDEENKKKPFKHQDAYLYKRIVKLGQDILGKKIHPHVFRHSKAQAVSDNSAEILGISNYLGHSSTKTTEIYVKNSSAIGRKTFKDHSVDILEAEK